MLRTIPELVQEIQQTIRSVLEMKVSELYPNAVTPIYIHCATGARATLAAEPGLSAGFCYHL